MPNLNRLRDFIDNAGSEARAQWPSMSIGCPSVTLRLSTRILLELAFLLPTINESWRLAGWSRGALSDGLELLITRGNEPAK